MKSKSEIALYAHITGMDEFQSKLERLIHAAEEFNAAAKALRETKLEVTLSGEEPERTEIWNFHTDMCNPAQTTTISGGVAEGFTQGMQAGVDAEAKSKNRVLTREEALELPEGARVWVEERHTGCKGSVYVAFMYDGGIRLGDGESYWGIYSERQDCFNYSFRAWPLPQPPTPEELAANPWEDAQ